MHNVTCRYLGPPNGQDIKVECPRISGTPTRSAVVHQCLHPERAHPRTGRPKRCIPGWAGPWILPEQRTEAVIYQLCVCCLLRVEAHS